MTTTAGPPADTGQTPAPSPSGPGWLRRHRTPLVAAGAAVAVAGAVFGGVSLVWRPARLRADGAALAGLDIPPGATVSGARAVGPHGTVTPLDVRGGGLWPRRPLASGERVRVEVTVHRPAAVAWATGGTSHLSMELRTPSARVRTRWISVARGAPLRVRFDQPVASVVVARPGAAPAAQPLADPSAVVRLDRPADAGEAGVAGVARSWERPAPSTTVSWFPAGPHPVAVAAPAAGGTIDPRAPLRLTVSRPVASALGGRKPAITPSVPGRWSAPDAHTLVFTPSGLGFPLGATVRMTLPGDAALAGGGHAASWTVPGGSETRLQQLLAQLGYLPLRFRADHTVARTPEAELAAAVRPPAGRFTWRWRSVPSGLRTLWTPGRDSVMTRGAVMAFERDHGLTTDGLAGWRVWEALLTAAMKGDGVAPHYTFVMVTRSLPQSLALWRDGRVIIRSAVNTGIAAAPTAPGTYAVYEHLSSTTMSGTNPDGSHYNDPGVPWVSYFNGGDALHGFPRGSYGVPQSLGCVELPIDAAGKVWPYTPVGTLVSIL